MGDYNTNNINNSASQLIKSINTVIDDKLKTVLRLDSAIVKRVGNNGTVDIYFPPENNIEFTSISNQTPFTLYPGDSVEVLIKDGSYSNCWIVAKHKVSNDLTKQIEQALKKVALYSDVTTSAKVKAVGFRILGTYPTLEELKIAIVNPNQGDMYNVGTEGNYKVYMWDTTGTPDWKDQGSLSIIVSVEAMTDSDIENLWKNTFGSFCPGEDVSIMTDTDIENLWENA